MPTFSFAPAKKVVKVKANAKPSNKYEIINADVEGIIRIDIEGKYRVLSGKAEYNIASEDYSCQGVTEIYEQTLDNSLVRTRHIRSERDKSDRDRTMYLPFTAGCSVKGNIVRHRTANIVVFKIKKVFIDVDNYLAKQAIKFYRDNYITIRKAIDKDWIDNHVPEPEQHVLSDVIDKTDND